MRWVAAVIVLIVALLVVQLVRPAPAPTLAATLTATVKEPGTLRLPWPNQGEAAVGVEGMGMLAHQGANTPMPIASLAKLMTAYLVLKAHPLGYYDNGPTITFTAADARLYQQYKADGQSVAKVVAGEKLSERQALELMLLPSANNVAVNLGQWVAGSNAKFVALMNRTAKQLGLTETHYADASGVSPNTESTAIDQLKLAELDMQIPVFRAIVAMPQVILPVSGKSFNVNSELGHDGVIGIKTGSTPQAGGCWVFAGTDTVHGRAVTIVGAVLGQQAYYSLQAALNAGLNLLNATRRQLTVRTWMTAGQQVASIRAPWTAAIPVTTRAAVTTIAWPGLTAHLRLVTHRLKDPFGVNTRVGAVTIRTADSSFQIPVATTSSLKAPGLRWRLTRL